MHIVVKVVPKILNTLKMTRNNKNNEYNTNVKPLQRVQLKNHNNPVIVDILNTSKCQTLSYCHITRWKFSSQPSSKPQLSASHRSKSTQHVLRTFSVLYIHLVHCKALWRINDFCVCSYSQYCHFNLKQNDKKAGTNNTFKSHMDTMKTSNLFLQIYY